MVQAGIKDDGENMRAAVGRRSSKTDEADGFADYALMIFNRAQGCLGF